MKIWQWQDLTSLSLNDLPRIFVFHSEGIKSEELKKQIGLWISPSDMTLIKGQDGKPSFKNSKWHFNISHSGNLTAVILDPNKPVGIDIERWRTKSKLSPITERYFFEDEKNALAQISDVLKWESEALRMWTTKEAVIKKRGGTLFEALDQINSMVPQDQTSWIEPGKYALTYL